MVWKKIMNRKQWQTDMAEKTPGQAADELQQYLVQLLPEWNLRLLAESKFLTEEILWVESVTVTAYHSAPAKESSGKPGRIGKYLMGMLGQARSLKK